MNAAQHLLVWGLRGYRAAISPGLRLVLGPLAQCRFQPTCSAYALEAVTRHGARAGTRLAVGRILRCHPWGGCGWDPVPERTGPMVNRAAAALDAADSHGS